MNNGSDRRVWKRLWYVLVIYFAIFVAGFAEKSQNQSTTLKPAITRTTSKIETKIVASTQETPSENTKNAQTLQTICSANDNSSSCILALTTPAGSLSTTAAPTSSMKPPTEAPEIINYISSHTPSDRDICPCNLRLNFCDVNCCCDYDCLDENRAVFGYCEPDFHHYDTRYCEFIKYLYINNSQHEWHVNQNGLFCVVKSNAPPTYIVQRKNPLKSFEEAEFQMGDKYTWRRDKIDDSPDVEFQPHFYTFGTPLWIIRSGKLETLRIRKSFLSDVCAMTRNVDFLDDLGSSCLQTNVEAENPELDITHYFQNITIIGAPQNFSSDLIGNLQNCSRCLNITAKICRDHFENCVEMPKSSTKYKPVCHWSITRTLYACENLVKNVKYKFHHNGSRGVEKAELFAILQNVTFQPIRDNIEIAQVFQINFVWSNRDLNYSSYLSGNPGYLLGKHILIAAKQNITNNSTNATATEIIRPSGDYTKNVFVLPDIDSGGLCIFNKNHYSPVEFRYNSKSRCKLREFVRNMRNISANALCADVQKTIFKYWSFQGDRMNASLRDKLIGNFGNANIHRAKEWSSLLYRQDLSDILNGTFGKFQSPDNKSVICGNIATNLILNFYHARIDFKSVLNQEKILATTVEFHNFKNLTFEYNAKSGFQFGLEIGAQVAFIDITSQKIRKIVDPPSLNIKLPSDFFYPFIKIRNSASRSSLSSCFLLMVSVLIFH